MSEQLVEQIARMIQITLPSSWDDLDLEDQESAKAVVRFAIIPFIEATKVEGVRLGIEAAAKVARDYASKAGNRGWVTSPESAGTAARHIAQNVKALDPKQIAGGNDDRAG